MKRLCVSVCAGAVWLQGDTLQNVAQELECIISTGSYTFNLGGEEVGNGKGEMLLEYEAAASAPLPPTATPTLEKSESQAMLGGSRKKERWTGEQIGDFLRKLGFMDVDKNKGGDKIKDFLHLSQVITPTSVCHAPFVSVGCAYAQLITPFTFHTPMLMCPPP